MSMSMLTKRQLHRIQRGRTNDLLKWLRFRIGHHLNRSAFASQAHRDNDPECSCNDCQFSRQPE